MTVRLGNLLLLGIAGLGLAACVGNGTSEATVSVAGAVGEQVPPASSPPIEPSQPPATSPPNTPPSINGSPAKQVTAGSTYGFTPTASDAEGSTLAFTITGKPGWADFSVATGKLSGTPDEADAGKYSNIVIAAHDGAASTSLAAFSIEVISALPPAPIGVATLSWLPPTTNVDGSPIIGVAGYRIYHGTSADALESVQEIKNAGITTYVFDGLAAGSHYFALTTVLTSGVESVKSAVVKKVL